MRRRFRVGHWGRQRRSLAVVLILSAFFLALRYFR